MKAAEKPAARVSDSASKCAPDPDGSCSICADEALPGVVISVNTSEGMADVRLPNHVATVALDLIDEPAPGDIVMVHMGFAISSTQSEPT